MAYHTHARSHTGRKFGKKPALGRFSATRPHGSGGRPSFKKRPFGGGNRGGSKGGFKGGSFFDLSQFINKAVITEEVETFIPEHKFSDFHIEPRLKEAIAAKGYIAPTPIQDRAIPHVLIGQDVVGIANTGTGKTATFLIPLINKILKNKNERVLVMVPTRELAVQIGDELRGFTPGLGIYAAICVGGAGIGPQIGALRRRPQFVIGTPGRLKDLIERKALNLSTFNTAVLDEADRMLDMGFINDMKTILALLPTPRHTLFFSATLSREIEALIGQFLKEPVRISVKTRETSASIDQDVVRVPKGADKLNVLHDLLITPEFEKVLIFGRTKHGVEKLSKILNQRGFKSESIHGNKTQGARQRALDAFKKGHMNILVATDVAARGLDISGVSHVINYDLPASREDYVHRIGRTGRAGKRGKALTFIEA
ncbi:MAG TPA: DEAD/DEAH box helicase [Candidatus Paceibacterota bacterium]|nr:DEAD/DEAH box helicase [Candidatus Paceibacterota bacterium]